MMVSRKFIIGAICAVVVTALLLAKLTGPQKPETGDAAATTVPAAGLAGTASSTLFFALRNDLIDYDAPSSSYGVAVADADGDGDVDIWLGQHNDGSTSVFMRNRLDEAAGAFERQPVDVIGDRHDGVWVDLDGDGVRDLFVVRGGAKAGQVEKTIEALGNLVLINRGYREGQLVLERSDGGHSDTGSRGLYYSHGRGRTATFLDVNRDCRLDVVLANAALPDGAYPTALFVQQRDGSFALASDRLNPSGNGVITAFPADFNGDGVMDLFLLGQRKPNALAYGDGTGFRSANDDLPRALRGTRATDAVVADFNGDLRPDLWLATDMSASGKRGRDRLFLNTGKGFVDASRASGIAKSVFHSKNATSGDFDNDGDVDVYEVNADYSPRGAKGNRPNVFWENTGNSGVVESDGQQLQVPVFVAHSGAGYAPSGDNGLGSTVAAGDFNDDGALDLIVANGSKGETRYPEYFHRGSYDLFLGGDRGDNAWLTLDLAGTPPNTAAIGAVVLATVDGKTQMRTAVNGVHSRTQDDPRLHFGFGATGQASRAKLDIAWADGTRQVIEDVALNQVLRVVEPTGGCLEQPGE